MKQNFVYLFRNQLDVYHPGSKSNEKKLPVCVFVTGGKIVNNISKFLFVFFSEKEKILTFFNKFLKKPSFHKV